MGWGNALDALIPSFSTSLDQQEKAEDKAGRLK